MAGIDPSTNELAVAILDVGGRYGRVAPSKSAHARDWRRARVDVEVMPDRLLRVASIVGSQWERQLRAEGLKPQPRTSRRLQSGSAVEEAAHVLVRGEIASGVQESLSAYLALRHDEIHPEDRRMLELALEGLSGRDIAAQMGVAYETVRDRLQRHRTRAGLGLPPRLRRARMYLERHAWSTEPEPERAIWERFCGGDGYQTIARALRIEWRIVVTTLHKHRLRAGIDLG